MQPTATTIICNACSTEFPKDMVAKGRPHVFCSAECKKVGRTLKIRHCMWCGDAYSIIKHGTTERFCSFEHEDLHLQLRRGRSVGRCAVCISPLTSTSKNWCSWACMLLSSEQDSLKCDHCGNEIPPQDGEFKNYPKFCSATCRSTNFHNRFDALLSTPLSPSTVEPSTKLQVYKDALFSTVRPPHTIAIPGSTWPRASGNGFNNRMRFPTGFSVPVHVQRSLAYWAMQCASGATPASVATLNAALSFQRPWRHPYMPLAFEQVAHFLPRDLYTFKQETLHAHRTRPTSAARVEREFHALFEQFMGINPYDYQVLNNDRSTSKFYNKAIRTHQRHLPLVSWHRPDAQLPWVLGQLNLTLMEVDLALDGISGAFGDKPRPYITDHTWLLNEAGFSVKVPDNGPGAIDGEWWWSPTNPLFDVRNHNQYILQHKTNAPKGYTHKGAVYPTWGGGMVPTHDPA